MNDTANLALLPEGLHDDLPPLAAHEARVIERLIGAFSAQGYERVKPPLIEFEESLLAGPGASVARHMFRLMDPISQRMMAVRADMTTQVARIAITRLRELPRPLRLCYAGQVLRVRGAQLRPERQFAQAGVELIGADLPAGDAEVVLLAAESVKAVGVTQLSVDLTVPSLVPIVCDHFGLAPALAERVRAALDRKDRAALAGLPEDAKALLSGVLDAAGPVATALPALQSLALPPGAKTIADRLAEVVAVLRADGEDLTMTVDAGESRGFEYQTGVSFTLLAKGVRGELGRGGRYDLATGEPATGFTLYMDSVMRALPSPTNDRKLYLPAGTPASAAKNCRADGWRTVRGLAAVDSAPDEARRLGCSHIFLDGAAVEVN